MSPPILLVAALTAVGVLLFALERLRPLRREKAQLVGRLVVNVVVSAMAFGAAALVVRPLVVSLASWTAAEPFGIVPVLGLSSFAATATAFLLLDLSFYYWHVANHRVSFLWRFHNVHHIDPDLDVTTALRFHFGEVALSAAFRVVQITLIGPSLAAYAVYEAAFQAGTLFHHSNVRLPIRVERALNLLLVTPRMHGIHHSCVREENQSNYSVVLSWWDRLHRSVRLNVPQGVVVIGVPAYQEPEDNRLGAVLGLPFRRQRDYWRGADGSLVARDPAELRGSRNLLQP